MPHLSKASGLLSLDVGRVADPTEPWEWERSAESLAPFLWPQPPKRVHDGGSLRCPIGSNQTPLGSWLPCTPRPDWKQQDMRAQLPSCVLALYALDWTLTPQSTGQLPPQSTGGLSRKGKGLLSHLSLLALTCLADHIGWMGCWFRSPQGQLSHLPFPPHHLLETKAGQEDPWATSGQNEDTLKRLQGQGTLVWPRRWGEHQGAPRWKLSPVHNQAFPRALRQCWDLSTLQGTKAGVVWVQGSGALVKREQGLVKARLV